MIELAIAHLGVVIVYLNGPTWLRPPVRPFTCGYCMCWWLGWLTWAFMPCWGMAMHVFILMAIGAAFGATWPGLFFDGRGDLRPEPDSLDDTTKPSFKQTFVDKPMPADYREAAVLETGVERKSLQGLDPHTVETVITKNER